MPDESAGEVPCNLAAARGYRSKSQLPRRVCESNCTGCTCRGWLANQVGGLADHKPSELRRLRAQDLEPMRCEAEAALERVRL